MVMEVIGELLKLTVLTGFTIAGILVILIWKKGLATKVTYLRFVIQAASLAVFFYIFTYPIWLLVMLIVILVMPIVLGRFFCGWLCPFGLYMDLITVVRKAFKVAESEKPGPTHIEISGEVAAEPALGAPLARTPIEYPRPGQDAVRRAANIIASSRQPMILAGNGVVRRRGGPVQRGGRDTGAGQKRATKEKEEDRCR